MHKPKIAIFGGGLAGLTCAKYLADEGFPIDLFESQAFLGGRASTYRDADQDWIEQGLHLFLGTYSEFRTLLKDIHQDPDKILFWMSELRLQDPQGPQAVFGINPIRAPIKTVLGILGQNQYLGPIDKLSFLPLMAPSIRSMKKLQRYHDQETVTEYWSRLNRNKTVMERFIRPFCRAIQFTDAEQFSAYTFLGLVHNLLRDIPNALAGGYQGPRDETIFQPLARYLRSHGTNIQMEAKLTNIEYSPRGNKENPFGQIKGMILNDAKRIQADIYVIAIPVWEFVPLIPHSLRQIPYFSNLSTLPVSPAISVQIWFDRKVIDTPAFTLVARSRVAVYQDQSTNAYPYPQGSRISVIVSPADDLLEESNEKILELVLDSLSQVEPSIKNSRVVKSVVLKHKYHLLRPLPGVMARRPQQKTPLPNLFLAGDWTQQPYFGSQEGAVRGGKACAQQIMRSVQGTRISQFFRKSA